MDAKPMTPAEIAARLRNRSVGGYLPSLHAAAADCIDAQAAEITALRAELAEARLQISGGDMLIHAANLERDALAARLAVPGEEELDALIREYRADADFVGNCPGEREKCREVADTLTALRARVAGLEGARVAARKALDAWDWWYEEETNVDMPVIAMEDLRQALHTLSPSAAQEACDNG